MCWAKPVMMIYPAVPANDTVYGSYGNDLLFGEDGNDLLYGEQDADYLDGGAGNDSFVFNAALTANTDNITDFAPVDDTIRLENLIFTKLTVPGVLTADFFGH